MAARCSEEVVLSTYQPRAACWCRDDSSCCTRFVPSGLKRLAVLRVKLFLYFVIVQKKKQFQIERNIVYHIVAFPSEHVRVAVSTAAQRNKLTASIKLGQDKTSESVPLVLR